MSFDESRKENALSEYAKGELWEPVGGDLEEDPLRVLLQSESIPETEILELPSEESGGEGELKFERTKKLYSQEAVNVLRKSLEKVAGYKEQCIFSPSEVLRQLNQDQLLSQCVERYDEYYITDILNELNFDIDSSEVENAAFSSNLDEDDELNESDEELEIIES